MISLSKDYVGASPLWLNWSLKHSSLMTFSDFVRYSHLKVGVKYQPSFLHMSVDHHDTTCDRPFTGLKLSFHGCIRQDSKDFDSSLTKNILNFSELIWLSLTLSSDSTE